MWNCHRMWFGYYHHRVDRIHFCDRIRAIDDAGVDCRYNLSLRQLITYVRFERRQRLQSLVSLE